MPLPNNVQRDVLGTILAGDLPVDQFEPEDFTGDNRTIFRRMLDVHVAGEPPDTVHVATELMKNCELEKCGGLSYLNELKRG